MSVGERRCEACEVRIPDGARTYWADTQLCAGCALTIMAGERDSLAERLRGAVAASERVAKAWDAWMADMHGDENDEAAFHVLKDAIDGLRGGQ